MSDLIVTAIMLVGLVTWIYGVVEEIRHPHKPSINDFTFGYDCWGGGATKEEIERCKKMLAEWEREKSVEHTPS